MTDSGRSGDDRWGGEETDADGPVGRAAESGGGGAPGRREGLPGTAGRGASEPSGAARSMHALRDEFPVGELPLDDVFALLADRRRRFALHALHENDADSGTTDLPRLTRQVAGQEATADREFEDPTGNGPVRRDLDERVLPQLDDAGVLDYDPRSGAVRFYGHPVVEEYLGHVRGLEWTD